MAVYNSELNVKRAEKLKAEIRRRYAQEDFAKLLGMSRSGLNLKLNGINQFKADEIDKIESLTGLKREDWY